jgi:5-methylcytosine-specific restriction endonuclease McrA
VKRKRDTSYFGLEDPRLALMDAPTRRRHFRSLVYERARGICALCGRRLDYHSMHLDHIVPKSQGGAYHWDNLRPVHRFCNTSRGAGRWVDPERAARRVEADEEREWEELGGPALLASLEETYGRRAPV